VTTPAPADSPRNQPSAAASGASGLAGIRPARPALLADWRGLTAAGAATLVLFAAGVGALVDALLNLPHHRAFSLLFAASSAGTAWRVHREDMFATVCIPPIAFVVVTVIGGLFVNSDVGGLVTRQVVQLGNALVIDAPQLLLAEALAIVVVLLRLMVGRSRR
jgi:hypothetical protein